MAALPASQQSDWNNNLYVVATIHILIGVAYLVKLLYSLMPVTWDRRTASAAHVVADGLELVNIPSNLPIIVPGAADIGPDLEANLTLDARRPEPTYDPQNHRARSLANFPTQRQSAEVSGQSAAVQTVAEQDVGVRYDDGHIEEDMNITISDGRQETVAGSAMDEEICEPATPPAEDTILPSADA